MRWWLILMAVLVISGVAVPYGVLGGAEPGLAIAVFWLGFGVVLAGMIAFAVLRWRDAT